MENEYDGDGWLKVRENAVCGCVLGVHVMGAIFRMKA